MNKKKSFLACLMLMAAIAFISPPVHAAVAVPPKYQEERISVGAGNGSASIIFNRSSFPVVRSLSFGHSDKNGFFISYRQSEVGEKNRFYSIFYVGIIEIEGDIQNAVMRFAVNHSWLSENKIEENAVRLSHYDDVAMKWDDVKTVFAGADEGVALYESRPPALPGYYIISGSPSPIEFGVVLGCNDNGICEKEKGESRENCPDCSLVRSSRCVPGERSCLDGYLRICRDDGSDFFSRECRNGCSDGMCSEEPAAGVPTGMAVLELPAAVAVLMLLVFAVLYLMMSFRRERERFDNAMKNMRQF